MPLAIASTVQTDTPEPQAPDALHTLTKPEKAAILLSVLLKAGIAPNLDDISTLALKQTVDTMATFGDVEQTTVDEVILEFLTELAGFGVSLRGELEQTLDALKGHVSEKVLTQIRKAYVRSPDVDVWTRIASADTRALRTALEAEHIAVQAIVLSKLPSTCAAEILGAMDPVNARAAMLAIVNAGDPLADVIELVGNSINDTLFSHTHASVFDKSPVERAGDIMNFARSEIRNAMMEDFGKNEPETAERIRKVMFTYPDIPARVKPRDVTAITRAIAPDTLLHALKGGETEAADATAFILESLSTRAADQLCDDIAELEPLKKKDIDKAMNAMIVAIRELEAGGTITLIYEDEEDD